MIIADYSNSLECALKTGSFGTAQHGLSSGFVVNTLTWNIFLNNVSFNTDVFIWFNYVILCLLKWQSCWEKLSQMNIFFNVPLSPKSLFHTQIPDGIYPPPRRSWRSSVRTACVKWSRSQRTWRPGTCASSWSIKAIVWMTTVGHLWSTTRCWG